MDPLSVAASIIAVLQLSAKALAYLNDVKGASSDRAQIAVEASNIHSLLTNLRFRVESSKGSEPWYTAVRSLAIQGGPLDQFKVALLMLLDEMTEGGTLKKVGAALVWKLKRQETVDILNRMERLKSGIEIALQLDHFKLSEAIKSDTALLQVQVPVIHSKVDTIQQGQDDEQRHKILSWLSPSNHPAQQCDILARKQEGTGEWFITSPKFTSWLQQRGGTLFCPGIPGAGKTMIAAITIEHLSQVTSNTSDVVAYLYLNYKEKESQSAVDLLGSVIKQLVQAQPNIPASVTRLHNLHDRKGTRPSVGELADTLSLVVSDFTKVLLVVDALDESSDDNGTRPQLFAQLRSVQEKTGLQLMATSRPLPEIVSNFKDAPTLEVRADSDDVKRYVTGQLDRLPRCIQRDLALQDQVRDEITKVIDGMFLLARLHVDSLMDKKTKKAVISTLNILSKSKSALKDAYDDAIQRTENQLDGNSTFAKRALSWITLARRPLTKAELLCAFAVEPETAELDPDNMLDIDDVVSVCAGLVNVDDESGVIRLVHYTTQDYLESILETWNPEAQLDITKTCLAYLSFDAFQTVLTNYEVFERRLDDHKFLDYAAYHWGNHAVSVETEICEAACALLTDSNLALCNAQGLFKEDAFLLHVRWLADETSTLMHIVSQFGLCGVMRQLLSTSKDDTKTLVTVQDRWCRTPIFLAANQKHTAMSQLLYENGAELTMVPKFTIPSWYEIIPLHLASRCGQIDIVETLLGMGCSIDAENRHGKTALYLASKSGQEKVVELLIKRGAKVNVQSGEPPLRVAVRSDHSHVVSMLLKAGADPDGQYNHETHLGMVVTEGRETLVEMFLDAGVNTNAQVGAGWTALGRASYYGHTQIVRLLLAAGADVNVGPDDEKPLECAIQGGHDSIVELLIKAGADSGGRSLDAILIDLYSSTLEWQENRDQEKTQQEEEWWGIFQHKTKDPEPILTLLQPKPTILKPSLIPLQQG